MKIPILRGRNLMPGDTRAIVISQSLAVLWPADDPIGRMALGAKPSHVLSIVLRQFLRPVIAGLLVGVGGAAALSQILRRVLYGIGSLDPIAYLAAIGLFSATVAVAALLPARRALRVDPMRALRCD